jgi:hypothetical protein
MVGGVDGDTAVNKYGAIPTVVDGVRFASRAEASRYSELRLLEKAGQIVALTVQPRWPLTVNGYKVGTYVGDFAYSDVVSGRFIVEDVKSPPTKTPSYRLKRKLMLALHGLDVTEIEA